MRRRRQVLVFLAGAAAVWGAGPLAGAAAGAANSGAVPAARAAAAAGSWGKAIAVPGLAALNKGGGAEVSQVSCASAGNCAVGAYYTDRHHNQQGSVADERHGHWGRAIEVPGLEAVSAGQGAVVSSVSCGSAGNCATGGYYIELPNIVVPIVAAERGGRWSKAVALPGDGTVNSISCVSAGNCLASGGMAGENEYYFVGDAFIVVERGGRWGPARFVPGLRQLEHYGDPEIAGSWINSVACTSAGNCAAGGGYTDSNGNNHGFVAVERNGRWSTAIQVPGLAALNTGQFSEVLSVSCGSAGDCAAGGYYLHHGQQAFVTVERNGRWGTAIPVPGLAALNKGGQAQVTSVSCGSASSCAAGGYYTDRSQHNHGFVAVERDGRWGTAIQVPGLAALNKGGRNTQVLTVSCGSAGSCAAGGYYTDRSHHHQGFVVVERDGRWGRAIQVPGLERLNAGGSAEVGSLSCPPPGACAAGGFYTDRSRHQQGFVVAQTR